MSWLSSFQGKSTSRKTKHQDGDKSARPLKINRIGDQENNSNFLNTNSITKKFLQEEFTISSNIFGYNSGKKRQLTTSKGYSNSTNKSRMNIGTNDDNNNNDDFLPTTLLKLGKKTSTAIAWKCDQLVLEANYNPQYPLTAYKLIQTLMEDEELFDLYTKFKAELRKHSKISFGVEFSHEKDTFTEFEENEAISQIIASTSLTYSTNEC